MNRSTMKLLDYIFAKGIYKVNIKSGIIYNKNTGHIKKSYKNHSGLDCVGLQIPNSGYYDSKGKYRTKTRCFQVNEIITYFGGLFKNVKHPERWNIIFYTTGSKSNNSFNNLLLEKKSIAAKRNYKKSQHCYVFTDEDREKASKSQRKHNPFLIKYLRNEYYKEEKSIKEILEDINYNMPRSTLSDIIHSKIYADVK